MKQIISILIILFSATPPCSSQQEPGFSVTGYAGKDSLHIGTDTPNSQGTITINLDTYRGALQLEPVSAEYKDLLTHYRQTAAITSEARFEAAKAYARDTLPFNILYSSGIWQEYILQWAGFFANTSPNASIFAERFVPEIKEVLKRTLPAHPGVAAILTRDLIGIFEQNGLGQAAANIAAYSFGLDLKDNEIPSIAGRMLASAKLMGNPAPDIEGIGRPASALLLFYEPGCTHCDEQLSATTQQYRHLQEKGYRVISISAGLDGKTAGHPKETFPWTDQLCDPAGFEGDNFRNYGVVGTPTIYLVDSAGIIRGRYARLCDTGI